MRVSYQWLQQYTDIPWSPDELAERLTMAGLEVETVEPLAPPLEQIYVGEIDAIEAHPDAELRICQINLGSWVLQTLTAAPNVCEGMRVPVATAGAVLPNGVTIEATEMQGFTSEGMLCSETELGLGDDASGIMELPPDAAVGTPLTAALGLEDTILDIAIYANRPDCMSITGIAREVAALSGHPLRLPEPSVPEQPEPVHQLASITIEEPDLCPRYSARIARGIRIGPSPGWLQNRLRTAGMRPINAIVDITNYVMLELGQPLHAFDYDRLNEQSIIVRPARAGESLVTLDGAAHTLGPETLAICDSSGPTAIAGVMGGEASEVTAATTTLLLESAHFSPVSIRRTARRLKLPSEASARFERRTDPAGTIPALDRACELLAEYADAEILQGTLDVNYSTAGRRTLSFRPVRCTAMLGAEVPASDMAAILTRLGLGVDTASEPWRIEVPSYRPDLELECDLIEEVARIWGFDSIPYALPCSAMQAGSETDALRIADQLRTRLVGAGLLEAINYSFVHQKSPERLRMSNSQLIPITNPISEDMAAMRTTLLPRLLDCLQRNAHRQQNRVALFEIGSVFLSDQKRLVDQPEEPTHLAIALMGQRQESHFSRQPQNYDFFDIKGLAETVLDQFDADIHWQRGTHPTLHPERQIAVSFAEGGAVGHLGEIHPEVQKLYRLPEKAYVLEFNLSLLIPSERATPIYKPLARYPSMERDLALVVEETTESSTVVEAMHQAAGPLLQSIAVFDVYQGEQVPDGHKSIAFSLQFQGERTLTDEEINQSMEAIVSEVRERFQAKVR